MISEDVIWTPAGYAVDQTITKAWSVAIFKWLSGER